MMSAGMAAGIGAIKDGMTRYGPSLGLPEFRAAASEYVNREYGLDTKAENILAGPRAKQFEQLFCEGLDTRPQPIDRPRRERAGGFSAC